MKNLLHELYHGRIPGWNSRFHNNTETDAIREKIRSERKYFVSGMSPEDLKRFKELETLHHHLHSNRCKNTYINAFKLGVMLMCAVFMGEEQKNDDEF